MSTIMLALCALGGVAWAAIMIAKWKQADAAHNGRPLRLILWGMALTSCGSSVLTSIGNVSASDAVSAFGGVAFPAILLVGVLGTFAIKGRSSQPIIPIALLIFSVVLIVSTLVNGQIGTVTWLIATGLMYLPGLTMLIWRTAAPVETIRKCVLQISLFVVWASFLFAVVDLKHAMGDLPRRFAVGELQYRLAGVTPHPNLLAFVAALALILSLKVKSRFRPLNIMICLLILIAAEARTLTIGLVIGLLVYWIVSARGSRLVRLVNTTLVCAPLVVMFWPTLVSSFDDSSLGNDVSTFNSRTIVWSFVGDLWPQKPLLGWGAFAFNKKTLSNLSALGFDHAHNQLLESLIEGGLLAGIAMSIVIIGLGWSLLRTRDAQYVAVTSMALLFMATEVPLTLHDYGFSFAVVLGALLLAVLVPGPVARDVEDPESKLGKTDLHSRRLQAAIRSQEADRARVASQGMGLI